MQSILPASLIRLAKQCPAPLYVVGGCVRDFLAGLTPSAPRDFDICAPMDADTFAMHASHADFNVRAVFKNTGTVKLQDNDGIELEYSCFRSDKYVRGEHVPTAIYFTNDIRLDAKRRDFTANAVYYDIKQNAFIDPLDGIAAIREKRLTTVAPAEKVFSEDGLRLMRLARQAAALGFSPDEDCLNGATQHAGLILDISPERIYAELTAILHADEKYGVKDGHYQGLRILSQTRVLDYIIPELTKGRDMQQRADFHDHDVLEHSLRAVLYAPKSIRLAALLHDVGKPICQLRDNNTYNHPQEGAQLTKQILQRLKAPKKAIASTCELVTWHMYDLNCQTGENKLRRFFALHADILDDLLAIKQADFSACKDNLSPAPTCVRWNALLETMRKEGAPLSLKQLAIRGNDLLALGIPNTKIANTLQMLLLHAVTNPKANDTAALSRLALSLQNAKNK